MNKERLVKTFTDLVALDSPSFDEQAVCRYIQERLTALGVQVEEDDSAAATGSTCGNLLATIPGDPSLEVGALCCSYGHGGSSPEASRRSRTRTVTLPPVVIRY